MIRLTPAQWKIIQNRLREEHPSSVILIRSVMRRELGFTVRKHRDWTDRYPREIVFLDFFDDRMETWFRVKYAEMIPCN